MDANQRLSQAMIELLHQDPLMGEVLINISREMSERGAQAIELVWRHDRLVLQGTAARIKRLRMDELIQLLKHQALHIVWQHPVRYATSDDQERVSLACDIAVNQYLTNAPTGTATLEEMSQILRLPLKSNQDSSYYLQILRHLDVNQQRRLQRAMQQGHFKNSHGMHWGWFPPGNQLIRAGRMQRLVQQSQARLTTQQRGLLPQSLRATLTDTNRQYELPAIKAFWRLIEQIPHGNRVTRSRFNRRQPQRLELPGHTTRLVTRLMVFIDQSGSMSNETVSRSIELVNQLAKRAGLELMVGVFDAKVQREPELVSRSHPMEPLRYGGGGTSYQAVFDYLDQQRVNRQIPIIIITDGWGESTINNHGYQRVLWLLTSTTPLSVTNIPTLVSRLEEH